MRTAITFFFSLSLLTAASGCAATAPCDPYYPHAYPRVHSRTDAAIVGAAFVISLVARAAADSQAQDVAQEDDTSSDPPLRVRLGPIPPHQPPAAADAPDPSRTAFDLGGAYGALAHVDLSACKSDGLAPGYGRVEVAFAGDGSARDMHVALPAGSPEPARACVETAFRQVRVAPFDGAQVTVRRSFYVGA